MIMEDSIKKNTEVILKSIASDNKELYLKIKEEFPTLSTVQVFVILLIELNYPISEILVILGVTPDMINKSKELVREFKRKQKLKLYNHEKKELRK